MVNPAQELRVFIAIDLPESVKEFLRTTSRELQKYGADVKWVRPESIHLTLKFLGEIPADLVPRLERELRPVFGTQAPTELSIRGLGGFPGLSRPRVVWAGLVDAAGSLRPLVAALDRVLEPLGFAPERRPFSPHLTLGRVRSNTGISALTDGMRRHVDVTGPSFTADHATLFRSDLKPTGAEYTALCRFDFRRD